MNKQMKVASFIILFCSLSYMSGCTTIPPPSFEARLVDTVGNPIEGVLAFSYAYDSWWRQEGLAVSITEEDGAVYLYSPTEDFYFFKDGFYVVGPGFSPLAPGGSHSRPFSSDPVLQYAPSSYISFSRDIVLHKYNPNKTEDYDVIEVSVEEGKEGHILYADDLLEVEYLNNRMKVTAKAGNKLLRCRFFFFGCDSADEIASDTLSGDNIVFQAYVEGIPTKRIQIVFHAVLDGEAIFYVFLADIDQADQSVEYVQPRLESAPKFDPEAVTCRATDFYMNDEIKFEDIEKILRNALPYNDELHADFAAAWLATIRYHTECSRKWKFWR